MRSNKRILHLSLIVALILCSITVAVFAYLSTSSDEVVNSFTAAPETDPVINEALDDPLTIKQNVSVNVGAPGYSVYVRAVILVTWEDENGIYAQKPVEGDDYYIELNDTDWFLDGGFYYHKDPVSSGQSTKNLINTCYQLQDGPDDYQLHVEIIAQTIQARGMTDSQPGKDPVPAVTDAWGIRVNTSGQLYNTVVAVTGDTWESLATAYGVDKDALAALNGATVTDSITPDQMIILPNLA